MTETVVSIQESERRLYLRSDYPDWAQDFEGYLITTTEQEIFLGISSAQSCCERTGYFMSEDDVGAFIGAQLLDVKITNIERNKEKHVKIYDGNIMFVDFETNIGVLQFVVYNSHNGYYGHDALVMSNQLTYNTVL